MAKKKAIGFPVFKSYEWVGTPPDELLASAVSFAPGSLPGSLNMRLLSEWVPILEKARIRATNMQVVERFTINDRPRLFLELAEIKNTGEMLSFVSRNGLLDSVGPPGIPNFASQSKLLGGVIPSFNTLADFVVESMFINRALRAWSCGNDQNENFDFEVEFISKRLSNAQIGVDHRLRIVSQSGRLIDAIWVQIANAINAGQKISQCGHCGKFFEVGGGASRTDKSYCGNTCMVAAYRARKRAALQLRSEGASLREISKQTGSDVSTVKGWLAEKGEK